MAELKVQLFGGFNIQSNDQEVKTLQAERLILFLAYLFLNSNVATPRKQLAYLFWPSSTEEQARTNLRNLLHLLRRTLPELDTYFEIDGQRIQCRSDAPIHLDVMQFKDTLAAAKSSADDLSRMRFLREALGLYRGELLPGFFEDWVLLQREELHQAHLGALNQLAGLLEDARQYREAIEVINRLLRADPLNESAYRHAMHLHMLNADRANAIQVYHACAAALKQNLGIDPSSETKAAYEALIRSKDTGGTQLQLQQAAQGRHLVGRKQEWNRLREAWQSSQKSKAQMIIILGEAGIGKTRLASELMQWTQRQGIRTAFTQCYPLEGSLPFAPVITWLRTPDIREELENLAPLWKKEIARLLPELEKAESSSGPKWQRQRLFEAVARGLLGSGTPRLLILDDIQWSDQDTLEFLHYLLRYDPLAKLLIVATLRAEEVDEGHPIIKLRTGLQVRNQIMEIELEPLSLDEVGLLASDVLGKDLSADTESRIFRETEGNPLFTVEILRSGDYEAGGPLPSGLRSILTRRLGQLSTEARDLVGLAAAIGREFDFHLLAAVSQADENSLVHALDELWSRRIIQTQQGDTYSFTHGKLQDAAYETLSTIRRPILHRRVAEALLMRNSESALIADHFEKAGQYSLAMEQYLNAADEARRVFANQNAITHLEKALALLKKVSDTKDNEQKQIQCKVLESLGDLYGISSKEANAIPSYQEALALIPTIEKLKRASLLGKLAKTTGNRNPDLGEELFLQAETELGKRPEKHDTGWWDAWFTLQFDRIWMHYDSNNLEGMQSTFETIHPVIDLLEDTDKLAEYYFLLPTLSFRRDGYLSDESMLATSALALQLSYKGHNMELQTRTNFGYGFIQAMFGNFEAAIPYYEEGLRLARQIGYVEQEAYCVTYLAAAHRCAGHLDDCKIYSEQGIALCEREGFNSFASTGYANLGWIAWKQNDLKQAKMLSKKAVNGWSRNYPFYWYGVWTLIDLSLLALQTNEAVEYARKLRAPGQQVFAKEADELLIRAIAAAEHGESTKAASLLAKAVDWAKINHYL